MLVVFEIDENVLRPEAAAMLAEREALWVFCKTYRILPDWMVEGEGENIKFVQTKPPVKLVAPPVKPTSRTTPKKS